MIRKLETFIIVCAFAILSTQVVVAQDYQIMPTHKNFDLEQIKTEPDVGDDDKKAASVLRQRISREEQNASTVFRTGQINPRFEAYYKQVIVPALTRYDKESLKTLTEKHHKIIKDFATRVRAGSVRGYLVKDVFFPMLGQIAEGNYHPVVRYNALLTIGKLDQKIGKQRIEAPEPYSECLPYLIKKYNEFTDPKLAYLKYGAFKGIARIASISFQTPNPNASIKPILFAFLGPKPAGMNEDLFRTMQKTSVQTLGLLGDPNYADSFARMIKDKTVPVWIRAEAAVALSKTKTATYDAKKLEEAATSMATVMHDVLRAEVDKLNQQQQRIAILAARKKEVGAEPSAGTTGTGKSSKKPGQSAEDRAGGLASGGGGSGSMMPGGDSGGGSGSMSPGSGGGGSGAKSGRSRKGEVTIDQLPAYHIEVSRRRIKTLANGMVAAFGKNGGTTGLIRWANSNAALLTKVSKMKDHMIAADQAAEVGLGENDLEDNLTQALKRNYTNVADQLAQTLGIAKADAAAKAAPADSKKPAGNSFLGN